MVARNQGINVIGVEIFVGNKRRLVLSSMSDLAASSPEILCTAKHLQGERPGGTIDMWLGVLPSMVEIDQPLLTQISASAMICLPLLR